MTHLRRAAQIISQLKPAAMLGLAGVLGLLSGFFGHAPWRVFVIFALAVPLLVWMLDGIARQYPEPYQKFQKFQRGFWLGYFFGLGYFIAGLYWIAHAFLVTPLAALAPLGVLGLAAYLALFPAIAFAACLFVWPPGARRFLSLAFFWAIAECLRGFVATGFEWNLPAQSWLASDALAQNFSWLGIHSATLITIAAAASFAALGGAQGAQGAQNESHRAKRVAPPLMALSVFFALWAGGVWRLSAAPQDPPNTTAPEIVIVQPNIAQLDKWNPRMRDQIIKKYLAMSAAAFNTSKDTSQQKIMIWPEAALAIDIERATSLRAALAQIIPENAFLLTGLLRFDHAKRRAFNAIYLITDQGALGQSYDKIHLVPFGEYLPAQSFLENLGLRQLTGRRGGFDVGEIRNLLAHQGSPRFAPLICYEIAFAREVPGTKDRPDVLVNVTNDAWYGLSSGPYQHFDLARLRAIEQGLPVMRAANTGISAIIDSYGRIIAQQALGTHGIIRARLPAPLSSTLYSQWRDWVFIVLLTLVALFIIPQKNSL